MEDITIPNSVKDIGEWAFYGTKWLEKKEKENPLVVVNNIVIHGKNCEGQVVIPSGVTKITESAFRGGEKITEIVIPDTVTSIGYQAFNNCSNLENIIIPDSVNSIGTNVFDGTKWRENKKEENSLLIVNDILIEAFHVNAENVVVPEGVTRIEENAFHAHGAKTIVLPESLKTIGKEAFYECFNLDNVVIPDGVTTLEDGAFFACDSLHEITIPASVTNIDAEAFAYSDNLTTIKGYTGSYAETYANENGYEFISLGTVSNDLVQGNPGDSTDDKEKGIKYYDVDGTEGITLSDAQTILKYALKIMPCDTSYTLSDAQTCLKAALRIITIE